MNFTDSEIDGLIKGVFDGEIDKENLPENLYTAIAEFLQGGLYKGFGGSVADFGGTDLNLLQELRTNIYMFSAAKTYQEVRSMTDLMYEGDNLKPFKDFYEDAKGLYDTYNKNYAETEYNTAVASAEMGAKWNDIIKDADLFPLLKMTVVEDAQTTEICEPLDGITLPINDPFWDEFYPPNHWNCRSTVLQLDEGEVSSKSEVSKAKEHADEDMQDVFKMNVGKDEFVFSPEHPYFTSVPKEDRELAKENFGLPLPEDLTQRPSIKSIEDRIEEIKIEAKKLNDGIQEKKTIWEEKLAILKSKVDIEVEKLTKAATTETTQLERNILADQWRKVKAEYDDFARTKWQIKTGYHEAVTELLASSNGEAKFKLNMTRKQVSEITRARPGEAAFKKIIGNKLTTEENQVSIKMSKGREAFDPIKKQLKIGSLTTLDTVTHELGHWLEDTNKDYFDKVTSFYAKRTKNDKVEKLKNLFPNVNYKSYEITKKDDFIKPYTGRVYIFRDKQYATEITSMWFSHVYENLHEFITKDPEHFEFIFKMFNQ